MVERLPGPQKRMLHSKRKGVERLDFFWEDSHAGYIYIYIYWCVDGDNEWSISHQKPMQ